MTSMARAVPRMFPSHRHISVKHTPEEETDARGQDGDDDEGGRNSERNAVKC